MGDAPDDDTPNLLYVSRKGRLLPVRRSVSLAPDTVPKRRFLLLSGDFPVI